MSGKVDLWQHPVSKRYYVTWTVGTRSNRVSTRTRDIAEAEEFRASFVLGRNVGNPAKAPEVEVRILLDSYLNRHAKGLPSEERIKIAASHLKVFYSASAVSAVSARNHEEYIAKCRKEGKAPGTINRHLGVLRAALRFAVKSGDLVSAPFVPSLREPPPRPHVLTTAQIDALLKAARESADHQHVETFIMLASQTGARRSAILQLTWDRVDLNEATIDFRLPGVAHTRKRRAITGISAALVAYLAALRKRTKGTHVVQFRGKPRKSIKRAFAYVAEKAKLPHVTPHVLKHTFVSQALQVASPWVVSGMTATSIRTLQAVYGKHMVEDQKKAAEAMAQLTRKSRAKTSHRKNGRSRVKR
jgi:integrase